MSAYWESAVNEHFESWRGQPSPLTHPGHFKNKRENAKKYKVIAAREKLIQESKERKK